MTLDTIFDLASLTKVVATTTSVMMLVEQGRIRLSDRVAAYIPGFERYGKGDITIRHLLTHVSGLRPDVDLGELWTGYETAIALAVEEVPTSRPGERFVYSDINFFLLGDIVQRVSGQPLDRFARERIFEPLGMKDTTFNPPASLRPRIAPTESCTPLRLAVPGAGHDDAARRRARSDGAPDGRRGRARRPVQHGRGPGDASAACCSAAARFSGARILSPLAVAKMTSAGDARPASANVRGLGWDIDSTFSSNRGELLPIGSFGHTGFTGTSLWIDPVDRDVRRVPVEPRASRRQGRRDAAARPRRDGGRRRRDRRCRRRRAPASGPAATSARRAPSRRARLHAGADRDRRAARGRVRAAAREARRPRHQPHRRRARRRHARSMLLHGAKDVKLVALFSPEHGIRGIARRQGRVLDATRRPACRSTRSTARRAARPPRCSTGSTCSSSTCRTSARASTPTRRRWRTCWRRRRSGSLPVVVLDRPNPINGFQIEGPALDKAQLGFTGYFAPMPIRHGLTIGELARLFNGENKIGADLTVVAAKNWQRDAWFDETALPWINPSPNMRNLIQATLYPGIGAIETTNLSVGRGTDTPFEQVGAPWIDGAALAEALNARRIPGVRFYPVRFTPTSSKYAGQECQGVFLIVTDRTALRPVRLGVEIAAMLHKLYGATFELDAAERLFGSREGLARIRAGDDPAAIAASWSAAEARWRLLRAPYLLYR